MNTDYEKAERSQAAVEKAAQVWWWGWILMTGATAVLWPLSLADLAPKGAASGVTVGAVFFLLLTIDFKSSAVHTRSIIDLQKRVSALEGRLSEGSESQS